MASSTKKLSSNWKELQKKLHTSDTDDKVTKTKKAYRTKDKVKLENRNKKTLNSLSNPPSKHTSKVPYRILSVSNLPKDVKPYQLLQLDDSKLLLPEVSLSSTDLQLDPKKQELGKFVALDCEFVGTGPDGSKSILARVSIVNYFGHTLLDTFVRPTERVTDWRTWVSGVTPRSVINAPTLHQVQSQISDILNNRILVGHAVRHDLEVMMMSHPKGSIRDTSLYTPFREISKGRTPSLKALTKHFLNLDIQTGEHSSVEDAQATMLLYRLHKSGIERGHHNIRRGGAKPPIH